MTTLLSPQTVALVDIMLKAPPGPPPREGLRWKEATHRWIRDNSVEHPAPRPLSEIDTSDVMTALNTVREVSDWVREQDWSDEPTYAHIQDSESLRKYVLNSDEINSEMRKGGELDVATRQQLKEIQGLMKPLGSSQVLYRGLKRPLLKPDEEPGEQLSGERAEVGDVFASDTLVSTSRDPFIAMGFSRYQTMMEIHTAPDTMGITVDDSIPESAVKYRSEYETLLDVGEEYKVKSIERKKNFGYGVVDQYVVVEVLPQSDEGEIDKAPASPGPPPGPKPERFGEDVDWDSYTHRWVRDPDLKNPAPLPISEVDATDESAFQARMNEVERWVRDQNWRDEPSYIDISESDGLKQYVMNSASINTAMRTGTSLVPSTRRYIKEIQDLMKPLTSPQVLYRGLNMPLLMPDGVPAQEGDVFVSDSFMSTSRDPKIALSFADYEHTMMEIHTAIDTEGITIGTEDEDGWGVDEFETLLNVAGQYRVKSIERDKMIGYEYVDRYMVLEALPESEHGYKIDKVIVKAPKLLPGPPPGPKPERFGEDVDWNPQTHRWVCTEEGCGVTHVHDYGSRKEDFVPGQRVKISDAARSKSVRGKTAVVVRLADRGDGVTLLVEGEGKPRSFSWKSMEILVEPYSEGEGPDEIESEIDGTVEAVEDLSEMIENSDVPVEVESTIEISRPDFVDSWVVEEKWKKSRSWQLVEGVRVRKYDYGSHSYRHGEVEENYDRGKVGILWEDGESEKIVDSGLQIPYVEIVSTPIDVGQTDDVPIEKQRTTHLHRVEKLWRDVSKKMKETFPDAKSIVEGLYGKHDYQGLLERTLQNTSMYQAMSMSSLVKALKAGQLLNAAQTGKGTFTKGSREKMLDRYETIESKVLRVDDLHGEVESGRDVDKLSALPKYGFLASRDQMDLERIVGWGYGDVFVKYKEDTKRQATWTLGNSYDTNGLGAIRSPSSILMPEADHFYMGLYNLATGSRVASILEDEELTGDNKRSNDRLQEDVQRWKESASWKDLMATTSAVSYLETQIYGNLPIDSIEKVQTGSIKHAKRIRRELDKVGLSEVKVEPLLYDERLKALTVGYNEANPYSLNEEDIDSLGDYYIDKIYNSNAFLYLKNTYGVYTNHEVLQAIEGWSELKPSDNDIRDNLIPEYLLTDYLDDEVSKREVERVRREFDEGPGGKAGLEEVVAGMPLEELGKKAVRNVGADSVIVNKIMFNAERQSKSRYLKAVPISVKRKAIKTFWDEMAKGEDSKLTLAGKYKKSKSGFVNDIWNRDLLRGPVVEDAGNQIDKAPPGPPPRPHLEWHEETHRWWCGEDGCPEEHDHETDMVSDEQESERSARIDPVVPIENQREYYEGRINDQWNNAPEWFIEAYDEPLDIVKAVYGEHDYQGLIEDTVRDTSVYTAVGLESLKKIVSANQVKNAAQTGMGTYSRDRESIYHRYSSVEETLLGVRGLGDEVLEGEDTQALSALPKYGFLADKRGITVDTSMEVGYGNVFIKYKDDVRNKSTFTVGDTYNSLFDNMLMPPTSLVKPEAELALSSFFSPVESKLLIGQQQGKETDPHLQVALDYKQRAMDRWKKTGSYNDLASVTFQHYLEAQIYGELTLDDIEMIQTRSESDVEDIRDHLASAGVEGIRVESLGMQSEVRKSVMNSAARSIDLLLDNLIELRKAAPGPPPRPGLKWKESTHRWVRLDHGEEKPKGDHKGEDKNWGKDLEQISGRLGSQPGGKMRDKTDGKVYYVKWMTDVRNNTEDLASKLYRLVGVNVPNTEVIDLKGKSAVKSEWLDGARRMDFDEMHDSSEIREGFVADAWLANWDVVGMSADNIVDVGGVPYRIDPGGALNYRAMGALKPFGPEVRELDSMRDPRIAFEASQVFEDLSQEELEIGARKVLEVEPDEIRELVESTGLSHRDQQEMSRTLIDRQNDIAYQIFGRSRDEVMGGSVVKMIFKASPPPPGPPPGPKPKRFGDDVDWDPFKHKWVCNEEGCGVVHEHDYGAQKEDFVPGQRVKISESAKSKAARGKKASVIRHAPKGAGVTLLIDGEDKPRSFSWRSMEVLVEPYSEGEGPEDELVETPIEETVEAVEDLSEMIEDSDVPVEVEALIEIPRPNFADAWIENEIWQTPRSKVKVGMRVGEPERYGYEGKIKREGVVKESEGWFGKVEVEWEDGTEDTIHYKDLLIPRMKIISTPIDVGQTDDVPIEKQRTFHLEEVGKQWDNFYDYISDNYSTPRDIVEAVYGEHDYQGLLERTLQDTSMYMGIKMAAFSKVLKLGQFLSAAQTGKGTFTKGSREKMLDRYTNVEESILGVDGLRKDVEYGGDKERLSALPKYGFLASKDEMDHEEIVGWGYGDVFVKFKEDTKRQATWVLGNSYDSNNQGIRSPSSILMPEDEMLYMGLYTPSIGRLLVTKVKEDAEELHRSDKMLIKSFQENVQRWKESASWKDLMGTTNAVPYLEAQIYGRLTLDSIEKVQTGSVKYAKRLRRELDKAGLTDVNVEPLLYDERLKKISEGMDYDDPYSLNAEDIDGLGDYYIDALIERGPDDYFHNRLGIQTDPEVLKAIQGRHETEPSDEDILKYLTPSTLGLSYYYIRDDDIIETEVARVRKKFEDSPGGVEGLKHALADPPAEIVKLLDEQGELYKKVKQIYRYAKDIAEKRYIEGLPSSVKRKALKAYWDEMSKGKDGMLPEAHYESYRKTKAGFVKDVWNKDLLQGPIVSDEDTIIKKAAPGPPLGPKPKRFGDEVDWDQDLL